jgi:hypothetical protein
MKMSSPSLLGMSPRFLGAERKLALALRLTELLGHLPVASWLVAISPSQASVELYPVGSVTMSMTLYLH